jgi:hypothetical protein
MAGKQVVINGTAYTPNNVQVEETKIGTEWEAGDGSYHFAHRANKRTWRLSWKRVPVATRTSIRGIYTLVGTFPFVDEDAGSAVTVACPPGGFRSSIGLIAPGVTLYYDVELTLREA